jgi:hypothetical protein
MARRQLGSLPRSYQILPESIDFRIPGFEHLYQPGHKTLSPTRRSCEAWFHEFVDRVVAASASHTFLPVCRMSDGEFLFALGDQPPDLRLSAPAWWFAWARQRLSSWRRAGRLRPQTSIDGRLLYSSGRYTMEEVASARPKYATWARVLAQQGVLAMHLTYGMEPFQEHFFPALGRWMEANGITITAENYVPFYFVYAMLAGPRRHELLSGRSVAVVHSAAGGKRAAVEDGLRRAGVRSTEWFQVSNSRTLYDKLEISRVGGIYDLVLVGAGVGKLNILTQLVPLSAPCIDAGYMFEVWANPALAKLRPFCENKAVSSWHA